MSGRQAVPPFSPFPPPLQPLTYIALRHGKSLIYCANDQLLLVTSQVHSLGYGKIHAVFRSHRVHLRECFTGRWHLTQHISLLYSVVLKRRGGGGGYRMCAAYSSSYRAWNLYSVESCGEPERNKNLLPLTYSSYWYIERAPIALEAF